MVDLALQAALGAEAPFVFGAMQIDFPGYTLRLLDGAGELDIGGHKFVGMDPTFGTIDTIEFPDEVIADEAPELTVSLIPADDAAGATLASGLMQGSRVRLMVGAYDPNTNSVIGVPEQIFLGEIDVPTYESSSSGKIVSYTVTSVFERMFEVNEGQRASDGFHRSIWPGERGFEHVTGTVKNLYWGTTRPVPAGIGGGGSYAPGNYAQREYEQ